jgi:hypothetical protein
MSQLIDKQPAFDWESTGQEEMRQTYQRIRQRKAIEEAIHTSTSLSNLVSICCEVLENYGDQYTRELASSLLRDKVLVEIQTIKNDLESIT